MGLPSEEVAIYTYYSGKSSNHLNIKHPPPSHIHISSINPLTNTGMRKLTILLSLLLALTVGASAQKFALVDMQYILKNIPNYEMMNEQLETVSKRWEQEVKTLQNEAEMLYKKYQSDLVFLSAAQKKEREEAIVKTEQKAAELQGKYFGPEGELFKKRNEMMKPLQIGRASCRERV